MPVTMLLKIIFSAASVLLTFAFWGTLVAKCTQACWF